MQIALTPPLGKAAVAEVWIPTCAVANGIAVTSLNNPHTPTVNFSVEDHLITMMGAVDDDDSTIWSSFLVTNPDFRIHRTRNEGQDKTHATKTQLRSSLRALFTIDLDRLLHWSSPRCANARTSSGDGSQLRIMRLIERCLGAPHRLFRNYLTHGLGPSNMKSFSVVDTQALQHNERLLVLHCFGDRS